MDLVFSIARHSVIFLIRLYQWCISPMIGSACRFFPSCSEYATQAISKCGVCKGGWMALKRICKCHPYHPGGHDPVD